MRWVPSFLLGIVIAGLICNIWMYTHSLLPTAEVITAVAAAYVAGLYAGQIGKW